MYGNRSVVEDAVITWLQDAAIGGKGIDTAIDYNNDDLVGTALHKVLHSNTTTNNNTLTRADVFITTKQPGPIGYTQTITALQEALVRLQTSYVDLYLIHFPGNASETELRQETWLGMEEVVRRGWTKAIGVSNYGITELQETLEVATIRPALNQILWNPVTHDDALLEYCQRYGITVEAYSPLGGHQSRHGEVLALPVLQHLAVQHNLSTAQIALKWTLQHGMTLTTGTTNPQHMHTDLDVFQFRLTDSELALISQIQQQPHHQNYHSNGGTPTTTTTTNNDNSSIESSSSSSTLRKRHH